MFRHSIAVITIDPNLSSHLEDVFSEEYEIQLIPDHCEVLDQTMSCPPVLFIIDMQENAPDGFLLTSYIRRCTDIPILFVSNRKENLKRYKDIFFWDKNVSPVAISEVVSKILKSDGQG